MAKVNQYPLRILRQGWDADTGSLFSDKQRGPEALCCQIIYYEGLTVSLEEVTASTIDIILLITRERDGIGEKCLIRKLFSI